MSLKLKIGERTITEENILSYLVEYKLLEQLAAEIIIEENIKDIEYSTEEEQQALQQFCLSKQITSEEHLKLWREQNNLTEEQLQKQIVRTLKVGKFKQNKWSEQLESYFLKNKPVLDKVIYSMLRTRDPGIAQELYFRIQDEEDTFADLAKQYTQGSEIQTGGLIGPVEMNVPHPRVAQMLRISQPGQLLPPTRIEDWWIILRLEKYISAELTQNMKIRLVDEQFRLWLKEQINTQVSLINEDESSEVILNES